MGEKERQGLPEDSGGVNELLVEMRAKADAERLTALENAKSRVTEIQERSRRECERIEEQAEAELEAEIRAEGDRVLGEARSAARLEILAAKRAILNDVLDDARSAVEARVESGEYGEALSVLIREALDFVGSGAKVSVSDADLDLVRRIVNEERLGCTLKGGAEKRGSVTATSVDGKRRAENGLSVRLARLEEGGLADVARILFG